MANYGEVEARIVKEMSRFMRVNELGLLFEIEDIEGSISELRLIVEKFEGVHVSLKTELADNYDESYPEYTNQVNEAAEWTRKAKLEIRNRKEKQTKKQLRSEEKYLRVRIQQQIELMREVDSEFREDIEKNIKVAHDYVGEYSDIFARIEEWDKEFIDEFISTYNKICFDLNAFILDSEKRIQNIKLADKKAADEVKSTKIQKTIEHQKIEKISLCKSIFENINERISGLEKRCDIEVNKLTDFQILEEKTDLKIIDSDYNDILDRIIKLCEANPSQFDETKDFLQKIEIKKIELKKAIGSLRDNVTAEIATRDLSEEKIKNASILGIQLQKFKGHNSSLDFYTFKTEFEKLIVPRVQKSLLPDYLKNNYLDGQALQLVKEINDLDKIWDRLRSSFGNVDTLLNKKLCELENGEPLWKIKSDEKLIQSIIKLRNSMMELSTLAKRHNIEQSLFHTSNLAKIFHLLGRKRQTDITRKMIDSNKNEKEKWNEIIRFLDKEIKVKEQLLIFEKPEKRGDSPKTKKSNDGGYAGAYTVSTSKSKKCVICDKSDHIMTVTSKGYSVVNYFACEKFAKMTPSQRFQELKKKRLCFQCLTPGFKARHEGHCFNKYKCPNDDHRRFQFGLHVLICEKHKENKENLELLEAYKSECILTAGSSYKEFSKNIGISFHANHESYGSKSENSDSETSEVAIFLLQTISIKKQKYNIFFDSGCSDMICQKGAVNLLESEGRAKNILPGPLILSGVSDIKSVCEHGKYQISIPLHNGENLTMSGLCLDKITSNFPIYPMKDVEKEIHQNFVSTGGDPKTLPVLPVSVGGETHIMVGAAYLQYHPVKLHSLPNGLCIFKSQFANPDGSRGIVGGPHRIFSAIHKNVGNHVNMSAYICKMAQIYKNGYDISTDISLLDLKEYHSRFDTGELIFDKPGKSEKNVEMVSEDIVEALSSSIDGFIDDEIGQDTHPVENSTVDTNYLENCASLIFLNKRVPKCVKYFEKVESTGAEASYRCVRCQECDECKKSENVECISIAEEIEQGLIDKSVTVDLDKGYTVAKLPFLCNPIHKLSSNFHTAKRIYLSQIKRLNLNLKDKQDIIEAEKKLSDLGFVCSIDDLTEEQRKIIENSPVQYIIPWRVIWNPNSNTTPCRPVFDASHPTDTGFSLNNIVAKGRNNMNRLLQIFLRWRIRESAFHTDIQKMYNTIRLAEEHWCFQLYLWNSELDPNVEPSLKVIKTLIYGVKSSGNQAERGLRETAKLCEKEFPLENEIVQNDIYVDDCLSGTECHEKTINLTESLQVMLTKGGFNLKGVSVSGFDPPDKLKNEDNSVNVAGLKWYPKADVLSLNTSDLNFGKKMRGRKPPNLSGLLPESFTRRDCAGRVGEVFDLIGRFTPITAEFKLDLRELSTRNLDWNDVIPEDLVGKWRNNFEMISQLQEMKFRRCIVPEDAINLDMQTLELADASPFLACSTVYARFRRKNGLYSCQLLFARSKIIPKDMSMPRAELFAAVLNATTGHVVNLALKKYIKNRINLTDSQIVLYWINNKEMQLKEWVRGRVKEILRLTDKENWFYIESENMMADLGTRRGAKISDVSEVSQWINGRKWSNQDRTLFPIKTVGETKLTKEDLNNVKQEILKSDVSDNDWINKQLSEVYCESYTVSPAALNKVSERYKFSKFVVDPNKFRFRKVVRIVALVLKFVRNVKSKVNARCKNDSENDSEKYSENDSESEIDSENWSECAVSTNKLPDQLGFRNDKYLVTQDGKKFPFNSQKGLIVQLTEDDLIIALKYFYKKATSEIKQFLEKKAYRKFAKEKDGILYYVGRILPSQGFNKVINLSDVCIDLTMSSFCVPLIDKFSPIAYALVNEVHWYDFDARHSGNETVLRFTQKIAHIIEGRELVSQFRKECPRCHYLNKKAIEVAMGPVSCDNFHIAPAFYVCQVDLFGPYNSYSNVNKRASAKIWFVIFCCCVTGAVDIKVAEDYSATSFILAFIRFSCKVGFPRRLLPDAGSQLIKGCEGVKISFSDVHYRLQEHGVDFQVCPVGAHYMHGKVERKIKHVKESFSKCLHRDKLSIIQWETLGDQVANSINNLPIALSNVTKDLEHIDLLTPNRLILARNNNRCPIGSIKVSGDLIKIVQRNTDLHDIWFKVWLVSYVPSLMFIPKWYKSDRDPKIGDVVLFLKSEKEFDRQYQYGMIKNIHIGRDGKIRQMDIEYRNHTEKVNRCTTRGTREVIVIHPVDELGIIRELNVLVENMS